MVLIFGGAYQGKLNFAENNFGLLRDDIFFCSPNTARLDFSKKAVCGLHLFIRAALDAGVEPEEYLNQNLINLRDKIIICDDISSGIVPLSAQQRRLRETCGRCLRLLSYQADSVLRVFCGIAITIK
jgi:adenosyl cobinamide kinase/adenosyl cobinamide phosphate guanylyltransferase